MAHMNNQSAPFLYSYKGEIIMGGTAFKHLGYDSERMTVSEFKQYEQEIVDTLDKLGIENYKIPYVKEKDSFGDIDIVVVKQSDVGIFDKIVENIELFGLTDDFVVRNKQFMSILYKQKYQVDFISTSSDYAEYNVNYLSYNDLGNIIGRVIKESGFRHGHDGLYYVYREGNHYKQLIPLSKDYSKTLEILGLDPSVFKKGFDTFTEMFEYVSSCKYFKKSRFDLENLNNRNRVRDRKRKVYNQFVNYVSDLEESTQIVPSPFDIFPHLIDICFEIKKERSAYNKLKEVFNGQNIMKWTNLSGKELGNFISLVKLHPDFDERTQTIEDCELFIKEEYFRWNGK